MLSFELLARIRKELSLTGSALYETTVAIAERVNRKVHMLRLHGQATAVLNQIHAIHRHVGQHIAELAAKHRDDVGRRGQVEFADRMADDGCTSNHDDALKGGITQA